MAIFGPIPWVNSFGKTSIFRVFELLLFIGLKGVFSFQNIVKDIFLAKIASPKKLEKWPFLDRNHGLTPLAKRRFFVLLNFLFLQSRNAFFVVEYRKRYFPGLYYLKKFEKWTFLDQNHGIIPLEKCQFLDFSNFLFLQPRNALFRSRIQ